MNSAVIFTVNLFFVLSDHIPGRYKLNFVATWLKRLVNPYLQILFSAFWSVKNNNLFLVTVKVSNQLIISNNYLSENIIIIVG